MIETRFCTRCVISNHRPVASREYARVPGSEPGRMAFDAEEVCGACRVAEAKSKIDWEAREQDLRELLGRFRRSDGRPDVLVPGSGGKDSVLAAHVLKTRYDMHPLTVTWAPHQTTDVGRRNFYRWLDMGFDNILVTPNPKVHRLLTRLAFLKLLHPFQPFILGQRTLAPKIAAAHNIDLVVFGEDDAEYEGETGWQTRHEFTQDMHIGGVHERELMSLYGLTAHDLDIYRPPLSWVWGSEDLSTKTIALGHYLRWDPQSAYYYAVEHAGFEANELRTEGTYSKYNSIDDRMDPLHYYTMYTKFGIGRASHDASQEIRNGYLTREEGVALVHKYDAEPPRNESVNFYCDYMGLQPGEFWDTIARFKKAYPVVR